MRGCAVLTSLRTTGGHAFQTVMEKFHIAQAATKTISHQDPVTVSFVKQEHADEHQVEEEIIMRARVMTEHFANCLERVSCICETGIDRAKSAQAEALKLFQTEGVIVSVTNNSTLLFLSSNSQFVNRLA